MVVRILGRTTQWRHAMSDAQKQKAGGRVAPHALLCLDRQFTGDRLREAREWNDWSQADLARRTGLPSSAISHWESGRRMPSLENLWTLLFVLQVPADDVLGLRPNAKVHGSKTKKT